MTPSRRELLTAFLGLASANAACRKPVRGQVPGALVDAVAARGHLLRGAPPARVAPGSAVLDVLIVGGGVAGLSAGWRLRAAGVTDFALLELDSELGGTARSGRNDVSAYPWGAHYLPAPREDVGPVPRLLREMGLITSVDASGVPQFAEQSLVAEPEERLHYRGSWYEGLYLRAGASVEDLAQLRRFETAMNGFARARDAKGRKAFEVPIARGSDDAEWTALDRLSMAQWLEQQRFTSARLRWLVEYACRDDFGASAADTSAWAGIWYFAARQDGSELDDEGDARRGRGQGYLTWPAGNGELVRQLASAVGVERQRPGLLVHGLQRDGDRWVAHALDVGGSPLALAARQVVLACPRFVAARVVDQWRSAPPAFVREFHYSPWAVANLTLTEAPVSRGFPLAWDNVFYDSKSLGYVVATHQRARASSVGPTVLTWYYPLTGSDAPKERTRLLDTTYPEWEAVVMGDLLPAHPNLATAAARLEVMRWGHGMVRPRPGFVWGGARQQAQASLHDSLHFAHSDLGGLALFEEANFFGVAAAERVLAGLGRGGESWL